MSTGPSTMQEFLEQYGPLITQYGPLTVFALLMLSGIGLSVAEDIIIVPAGFLVGTGDLPLVPVLIASYVGVVLSDLLWFTLCYRFGTPLLHKRLIKRMVHPRRLLIAKHQFDKRGVWMLVIARFVPASRTTTITVCGLFRLAPWKFAVATALCVLITMPLQFGLGWLIAQNIATEQIADNILKLIGLIAVLIAIMLALTWWLQFRSSPHTFKRASIQWIKRFRVPRLHRRAKSATGSPSTDRSTSQT